MSTKIPPFWQTSLNFNPAGIFVAKDIPFQPAFQSVHYLAAIMNSTNVKEEKEVIETYGNN